MKVYERKTQMQWLRAMLLGAGISLFILITLGGMLASPAGANGSAFASINKGLISSCPDWPTCLGSWSPPEKSGAILDYAHRLSALVTAPFLAASLWIALRSFRENRLIIKAILISSSLFALQIGLGAWISLNPASLARSWLNAVHLLLSLISLSGVILGAILSFVPNNSTRNLSLNASFSRLTLALLGSLVALMISGAVVKASGAGLACQTWPLCGAGGFPQNSLQWLDMVHRGLTLLAGSLMIATWMQAWRRQRSQPVILTATTAAGVMFLAQALLGARLTIEHPTYLFWVHQATATASLAALIVLVTAAALAGRTNEEVMREAMASKNSPRRARDFLLLTKPIVVLLLLVTTFAGMVIGAREWPPLSLTFWTLLGGFLAAGGSGAINQFIDRADDEKMQRTQNRPIPSGRLTPGEGLAFGVGIALASFYVYVAFVNLLAAMLALAGIVYYVLLYSIFLKKTTVQNIVIGGGAGAIPPLVGWAAATGSLNIPSLFLFAIVFMWTPPHFWALALVRRKDYARAGVPMLPVVRGEQETRSQIMLYTIELVALTLMLPLFGLGGSIYLIGAAALGGWLTLAAYRVWKEGGNKLAWKMYRYSSMYLAFLFVILMIDRLV